MDAVIAVSYREIWQDGFGARGWKLDRTLDDPEIIATTAFPEAHIATSVLIHDLLDHYVSGFAASGHRAEAKALVQLHLRTGAMIQADFEQMIDEDVLAGRVLGEPLVHFLPPDLVALLPSHITDDPGRVRWLSNRLGPEVLRVALIARFYSLGAEGIVPALTRWQALGVDYARRQEIGLCLQGLLEAADRRATESAWDSARGQFQLGRDQCMLMIDEIIGHGHHRPPLVLSQPLARQAPINSARPAGTGV